jgi:hypothetical protein
LAASATVSRVTPGMEATGSLCALSVTTRVQIRSSGVSVFSRIMRRDQSCWRMRRRRVVGNWAMTVYLALRSSGGRRTPGGAPLV